MIQSLQRSMELLETMAVPDKSFSVSELSERLNLPPSTIHRILKTFCAMQYVTKDNVAHLYKLGPALILLGKAATQNIRMNDAAKPILKTLSEQTQEDAFLIIRVGYKGVVYDKVEGPNNLKVVERFGSEVDLHWGALRKVLLAYQTEEFIREYIEHGLTPSPSHEFDKNTLYEELQQIREDGYAASKGNYIANGYGVGAPVFDYQGQVIASIGIIAPSSKMKKEVINQMKKAVLDASKNLSRQLGYIK